MSGDPYSRFVAISKIALPILALVLLSTLFLLSDNKEPGEAIPFADLEMSDRIRNQQVTKPFFSGTTQTGDRIAFTAIELVTREDGGNEAHDLTARLDFADGGHVDLIADTGALARGTDAARLRGNVVVTTSHGYKMRTSELSAHLLKTDIIAPETVNVTSPMGTIVAGSMRITTPDQAAAAQLLFKQGVKLIYEPKVNK